MSSLVKRLFRCLLVARSTRVYNFVLNRLRLPATAPTHRSISRLRHPIFPLRIKVWT
ncbi:MAG: hypothetical protein KAU23_04825 [Anaerolineales bacterium]|nr:hypothetical protein [Anaerolineales bacterium]